MHTSSRAVALLAALAAAAPVFAQIHDPANDFVASYTGVQGADLDIASANATYNGSTITVWATVRGAVGTTTGGAYVWGFNRGAGTARFPSQAPGVLFDSVALIRPDGTGIINRLVGGSSTLLTSGAISISGNTITAILPISALPSQGFAPESYTWNVWTRGNVAGNAGLADFAPDNSNVLITTAPEPTTLALCALGVVGLVRRRRRA